MYDLSLRNDLESAIAKMAGRYGSSRATVAGQFVSPEDYRRNSRAANRQFRALQRLVRSLGDLR